MIFQNGYTQLLDRKIVYSYTGVPLNGGATDMSIQDIVGREFTYTVHPKSTGIYSLTIYYAPIGGQTGGYWGWNMPTILVNGNIVIENINVVGSGDKTYGWYYQYGACNTSILKKLNDGDVVTFKIIDGSSTVGSRVQSVLMCLTEVL